MSFVWDPNPIAISIETLHLHIYWYGILFALGFILGYLLARFICRRANLPVDKLDALLLYIFIGTIVGSRLFHVIFYQPSYYFSNPLEILYIWKGGLASHGGTIGTLIAIILFCYKNPEFKLMWLLDHLSIPTGLVACMIRIGNFINSEIVGKATGSDYGVIFARINDQVPLHPVQLYESAVYFSIFVLLLIGYFLGLDRRKGLFFGIFFVGVFGSRAILEIFKSNQAEYEIAMNNWLNEFVHMPFFVSVGMLLSIPFIIIGLTFIILSFRSKDDIANKN